MDAPKDSFFKEEVCKFGQGYELELNVSGACDKLMQNISKSQVTKPPAYHILSQ